MARILIIVASAIAALVALTLVAAGWTLGTDSGRDFLRARIEPRLSEAIGGSARIGAFEGAPPGKLVFRDVETQMASGDLIQANAIEIVWSPMALLSGAIAISAIELDGVTVTMAPDATKNAPRDDDKNAEPPSAPSELPNVAIDKFSIGDLRVIGPDGEIIATLFGEGFIKMGGRSLIAEFAGYSDEQSDVIDLAIDYDFNAPRSSVAVFFESEAQGAVARILGAGAPVSLNVRGEGPSQSLPMSLDGDFGAYGDFAAEVTIASDDATRAAIKGNATFGQKLANIAELLGPQANFDLEVSTDEAGGAAALREFSSSVGTLAGDATWRYRREALDALQARFTAVLAAENSPPLAELFGDEVQLEAAMARRRGAYDATISAVSERMQINLQDARTDLRNTLSGDLAISSTSLSHVLPVATHQIGLASILSVDLATAARLDNLVITENDSALFNGLASYQLAEESMAIAGALSVSPDLISRLAPQVLAAAPFVAQVDINGPVSSVRATIDADAPAATINGDATPAARIDAAFANIPALPSGEITATPLDGNGGLQLVFRSEESGAVTIPELNYYGPRFSLTGSAMLNAAAKAMTANLAYRGESGARPAPGLALSGDLSIAGSFAVESDANDIAITAPHLVFGEIAVDDLSARLAGPAEQVSVTARADAVTFNANNRIQDIAIGGVADLRHEPNLLLTTFSLANAERRIDLRDRALLSFSDGVSLDEAVLDISGGGEISLSGAATSSRLQTIISARETPIEALQGAVTFDINLDTDRTEIARGTASLRSDYAQKDAEPLAARFNWTNDILRVRDAVETLPLEFSVDYPLILDKSSGLDVRVDGALSGFMRYQGSIQQLAAFLPEHLQSLEGDANLDATIEGTTEKPKISGAASIENGAYTELQTGVSITNIEGSASATYDVNSTRIDFDAAARGAQQNQQTIALEGSISISEQSTLQSVLTLTDARFAAQPVVDARASGEVTLSGPLDALTAAGEITVNELNAEIVAAKSTGLVAIDVAALGDDGEPMEIRETNTGSAVDIDVAVVADDRIFIRGRGLESEWRANVKTVANADQSLILGRVDLRRGSLDFSGRRFDLTLGEIIFDRLAPNNPVLDMRAEYETGDGVVAAIVVKGRALSPDVSLESAPSLPREDIMALVLFGKPANELSATESLQMAQALAQLGGIGPFGGSGVLGSARSAIGLDLLNVDLDPETGGSALTVGKYVADGLFVSATQDVRGENGAVRIEYEITDNITIESELQQNGDQTVSANWKRDF